MPIPNHEEGRIEFRNTEWGNWSMPMQASTHLYSAIEALKKHFIGITDTEIKEIVGKYYTVPTEALEFYINEVNKEWD